METNHCQSTSPPPCESDNSNKTKLDLRIKMRLLLELLPDCELEGLLRSVTYSLFEFGDVPSNQNGTAEDAKAYAIDTIIKYSEDDVIGLLDNKHLKMAHMVDFLKKNDVKITMPPSKNSAKKDVLTYWGYKLTPLTNGSTSALNVNEPAPEKEETPETAGNFQHSFSSWEGYSQFQAPDFTNVAYNNLIASFQAPTIQLPPIDPAQQFAELFSNWYYPRLNSLTDFSPSLFWHECHLKLDIFYASSSSSYTTEVKNGEDTYATIINIVSIRQLHFNPNMTTGVGIHGHANPFGLMEVYVWGLLHYTDGTPAGMFKQRFGLMKQDPIFGNEYKINVSLLQLLITTARNDHPELWEPEPVGIVEIVE